MAAVDVKITPDAKVNRVEVIIRIILAIILGIIASIFAFIVGILAVVNFFTCLLLAKRIAPEFIAKFIEWVAKVGAYLYFVTDERPPWTPL
ncbi:MAG: DUF4389 domain-containing protein [Candidatus Diapherotrites archaeon]